MRKKLLTLVCLLLAAFTLAAASSSARLIDLDSDFYEDFDLLCASLGLVPKHTRPYSQSEASTYLEELSTRKMDEVQKRLYDKLCADWMVEGNGDETMQFSLYGSVNPQLFVHLDTDFSDQEIPYGKDPVSGELFVTDGYEYSRFNLYSAWPGTGVKDFADVNFALDFKDSLSLFFELPIANVRHTLTPFGSQIVMSNVVMLADLTAFRYEDFNFNFPYRAHLSAGGEWWTLLLGRDKLNYGSGYSGNFSVDAHLDYHNALSLSLFSRQFKYTYLLSFFPHPSQYLDLSASADGHYGTKLAYYQKQDAFTGTKAYVAHRFEWTSRNLRSRIAVTEAAMFVDDGGLDMQFLNPMIFLHNLYVPGNTNSTLTLEWDYTFTEGLRQNIAIIIDDLDVPGEAESDGDNRKPSAFGVQYSLSTANTVGLNFHDSNTNNPC